MRRLALAIGLAALLAAPPAAAEPKKKKSDTPSSVAKKKTKRSAKAKRQKPVAEPPREASGKALDRKLLELGDRSFYTASFGAY